MAEGTQAMIHCNTFGAPKPVITWTRDDEPIPYNFEVLKNGTLLIKVGNTFSTDVLHANRNGFTQTVPPNLELFFARGEDTVTTQPEA